MKWQKSKRTPRPNKDLLLQLLLSTPGLLILKLAFILFLSVSVSWKLSGCSCKIAPCEGWFLEGLLNPQHPNEEGNVHDETVAP